MIDAANANAANVANAADVANAANTTDADATSTTKATPNAATNAATVTRVSLSNDARTSSARCVYTPITGRQLARERAQNVRASTATPVCRLRRSPRRASLFLRREVRTDEKLRYTESELGAVIRTVLFTYVFGRQVRRCDSLGRIVRTGHVRHRVGGSGDIRRDVTLGTVVALLDGLFGEGFSAVARHSVAHYYDVYRSVWRYHGCGQTAHRAGIQDRTQLPSAADYLAMARFAKAQTVQYAPCVGFLVRSTIDHRAPLQGPVKVLAAAPARPGKSTADHRPAAGTKKCAKLEATHFGASRHL